RPDHLYYLGADAFTDPGDLLQFARSAPCNRVGYWQLEIADGGPGEPVRTDLEEILIFEFQQIRDSVQYSCYIRIAHDGRRGAGRILRGLHRDNLVRPRQLVNRLCRTSRLRRDFLQSGVSGDEFL